MKNRELQKKSKSLWNSEKRGNRWEPLHKHWAWPIQQFRMSWKTKKLLVYWATVIQQGRPRTTTTADDKKHYEDLWRKKPITTVSDITTNLHRFISLSESQMSSVYHKNKGTGLMVWFQFSITGFACINELILLNEQLISELLSKMLSSWVRRGKEIWNQ